MAEKEKEKTIIITWRGVLRDRITRFGRFRRGQSYVLPLSAGLQLIKEYDGFQISGDHTGSLTETIARSGGNIAYCRNRGLGDVIAAVLFGARPLALAHPDTTVDFFTDRNYIPIVKLFPFIRNVKELSGDFSEYDVVVDLSWVPEREDPKSLQSRPDIFARPAGNLADFEYEPIEIPEDLRKKAKILLNDDGRIWQRPLVGFQVTSASHVRIYPIPYLGDLVKLLIEDGFDVALFGQDNWGYSMSQWNGDHLLNYVDKLSILDVFGVMSWCDVFLAPDSGLMHAAAMMDLPCLALFGNIAPENRIKHYKRVEALYPRGELPCIPCGDVHNPCPECSNLGGGRSSGRCMHLLYPGRVLEAFRGFCEREIHLPRPGVGAWAKICPFCEGDGELVNTVQGKWFEEFYDQVVEYYRCKKCDSIYSDPSLETVSYEEEYWEGNPKKFCGDYFLDSGKARMKAAAARVKNLCKGDTL